MPAPTQSLDILVVDDSSIYRNIVQGCLEGIHGTRTVGIAKDGKEALTKVRELAPDLVLLDVEMPVMDGLETLRRMREGFPDVGIIMVSGLDRAATLETMTALRLGAFDFIVKPTVSSGQDGLAALQEPLREAVTAFGRRRGTSSIEAADDQARSSRADRAEVEVDVIAICTSTGGPGTLGQIIPQLPGDLPVPLLVAQRMPAGFTRSLAESLDRDSALQVCEARDGQVLLPGRVYIAPGGQHMSVVQGPDRRIVRIAPLESAEEPSPSADVLFSSLPTAYGRRALAVVLTGVGDDGLRGVVEVRSSGGYCLAQDHESSTVFDLPSSIISAGEADEVLSLADITRRLIDLSQA